MDPFVIVYLVLPLLVAFSLCASLLPVMIRVSANQGWFDVPDARKVHKKAIPRTGGLVVVPAIGIAILVNCLLDPGMRPLGLALGFTVLYLTGLRDDLKGMGAMPKLALQMVAATILAASGWRIESLPGIPGAESMPLLVQYGVTVIFVTAVINAYNLIDGIDGLAAGLAVMAGATFTWMLLQVGDREGATIAVAMTGAFAAFLLYNFSPARIFMGDTGSMGLGFLLAALSIRMLMADGSNGLSFQPWQALAILSTPIYDVLRVMIDRARRHGALFRAERNHIHHLVIGQGFSHRGAMGLILLCNGLATALAVLRPDMGTFLALPVISVVFLCAVGIFRNLAWYRMRREAEELTDEMAPLASDNPFFDRPVTKP